jgi:hypothetical protein
MSINMTPFNFVIDIPVRNEWANVDLVRNSILNCLSAIFRDTDGCHIIATVAGELLENAIKYGTWTKTESPFRLRVFGIGRKVEVSMENPVDPGSDAVKRVFATVEWINSFPSAADAYRAKLLEVASADRELGESRLGLVRIAYEGRCRLSAELAGDMLRVSSVAEY